MNNKSQWTQPHIQYGVILADPPWNMRNRGVNGAAAKHYPTLTDNQIISLPVERWAKDDSVLLLWCINSKIDVGLEVLAAWGFNYVTKFPWIKFTGDELNKKPSWGTGFWVRGCSEDILIGKRGHAKLPNTDYLGLLSDRLQHSRKPDSIYDYAESFPGPYLELFARTIAAGARSSAPWDVWGDEVPSTIDLLEGLPDDFLEGLAIHSLCNKISHAWKNSEESKWVIGDAIVQMIATGIPPMQAYRVAASKMGPNISSIFWPHIMYKMALVFPPDSRDPAISWNQYRVRYEQIRKIKHARYRSYWSKVHSVRKRVNEYFAKGAGVVSGSTGNSSSHTPPTI